MGSGAEKNNRQFHVTNQVSLTSVVLASSAPLPVHPVAVYLPVIGRGGGGDNHLLTGTLAAKLLTVLADMMFSGKSFQSLMVFCKNGDCWYMVYHWIRESCYGRPLLWWPATGTSFDLSTLMSLYGAFYRKLMVWYYTLSQACQVGQALL